MTFLIIALRFILLASQFFGPADAGDDILHMLDSDGLDALLTQFVKQFCNAGLNVVGYFLATLLLDEGGTKRLDILLQQLVGILVNLE